MLKAIIADDEQRIIALIKNLIDWDKFGIEIVAEANNGMDALLLVKEYMPDILITDIRFPGIDGLELTKRVFEIDPSISTIIISGHKQFDYAHTALKYGVAEYLVKPINKQALEGVLEKISISKQQQAMDMKKVADLIEEKHSNKIRRRNQFFYDCLGQHMTLDTISDINQEYFYDFVDGLYISWLVHVEVGGENEVNPHILTKIQQLIVGRLESEFIELQVVGFESDVIVIGNFDPSKSASIVTLIDNTYVSIRKDLEFYGKLTLISSASEITTSPAVLPEMFMQMKRAMFAKCMMTIPCVIYSEKVSGSTNKYFLTEADKIQFVSIIEKCETEELATWVKHKYEMIKTLTLHKPWMLYQGAIEIKELFKSLTADLEPIAKSYFDVDHVLIMANGEDELIGVLIRQLTKDLNKRSDEKKLRNSQPIRLAKKYMKEHLSEPITVEAISSHVNLSYTYFSGMFKNETGMTVSQYLLEKRIEQAKKSMRETTMNLSEIAMSVGYSDAKHFSKVFRKATSITYKEYKRLYS